MASNVVGTTTKTAIIATMATKNVTVTTALTKNSNVTTKTTTITITTKVTKTGTVKWSKVTQYLGFFKVEFKNPF